MSSVDTTEYIYTTTDIYHTTSVTTSVTTTVHMLLPLATGVTATSMLHCQYCGVEPDTIMTYI